MSFTNTKETIYNIALSALLLSEQVIEISTSKSNNISILNLFYDIALETTLQDLDLDSLSQPITLELVEELDYTYTWDYVYKYPSNSAFFRRIASGAHVDRKTTHIPKRTGMHNGQKSIFTNKYQAVAECIPKDIPLEAFSPMAALTVAYALANLAMPLIVGKGATKLRDKLEAYYKVYKFEAQETDRLENFNYEADYVRSEYVEERMSGP